MTRETDAIHEMDRMGTATIVIRMGEAEVTHRISNQARRISRKVGRITILHNIKIAILLNIKIAIKIGIRIGI